MNGVGFERSETLPPNFWDFYPTRSHELGFCFVTSSSAMEALGSPSFSRAPMSGPCFPNTET